MKSPLNQQQSKSRKLERREISNQSAILKDDCTLYMYTVHCVQTVQYTEQEHRDRYGVRAEAVRERRRQGAQVTHIA